ncbi:MAG TPA: cystathionine gamma-synthase [Chitinophagales bacterium]|nr:cystathionine gamma-synthase [Chitinophagales bacterium]
MKKKFGTKAIHAGIVPEPITGAIMTPIFQTSTYVQQSPGVHKGYEYARTQNPTRTVLENNLAALENGEHGICFSSGMAATDAILKMLEPGDEVISCNDLYGGSYRLFTKTYEKYGIKFHFVDMNDPKNVEEKMNAKTKLLWIETPTNPMLNIVDIKAISQLAQSKDTLVVVDNTFASPYLQTPLDMGADIVCHSATKYLGGHSDVILGAVVVKDKALADQLHYIQNASGAVPGPFDSWLILRGIKTLHVRVQRACENAQKIAEYLDQHPKVQKVNYPGLKSHPSYELAKRQMRMPGAMVSFTLKDDSLEAATEFLSKTKLFALAESLGGVESLIGHPATMTHASIPLEERKKTGVTDSLIRVSVGIEDVEDLIADLETAIG